MRVVKRRHKKVIRVDNYQKLINFGVAALFVFFFAFIGVKLIFPSHAQSPVYGPSTPPAQICGDSSILDGPATAPAGAVTVAAGDNSSLTLNNPSTTYWFAPGTHTIGSGQYSQINPGTNDTYIGAPGAIISGQNENEYAFVSNYEAPYDTGVTIEYLTIEDFIPPGSGGAINENGGPDWTIEYDTIENNLPGAAMMIGTDNVVQDNCITENGQYAFNAYTTLDTSSLTDGPSNITLADNEISYNDTCNWEVVSNFPITSPAGCSGAGQFDGCGCSGGGKFWEVDGATITDNYVHNNYDVGLWADTNNDGLTFQGNYIANNYGVGIQYEVSYNALIENNTFLDNAWGDGESNPGFPTGAIYISESGGDSRVPNSSGIQTITISGNTFTNNWDGVVLWENSNRFCSNGLPTTQCTLVDPSVVTVSSCQSALANSSENQPTDSPDYFDMCRWKTQNVEVTSNQFNITPSDISSDCTLANLCGVNALFSEYGSTSPYLSAIVPTNITFNQNNTFSDNVYNGTWGFEAWNQGSSDNPVSWSAWTAPVTDKCGSASELSSGACDSGFGQDAGSTYNGTITTTSPPSASITSPASNSFEHQTVTIDTSDTDNSGSGLASVSLDINGTKVATDSSSPYNFSLSLLPSTTGPITQDGEYTLTAVATDNDGNSTVSSPVTIYVNNGDFLNGCSVGLPDLAILAAHYGQTDSNYADGNITGQSTINLSDLAVLIGSWGWAYSGTCPI